MVVVRRAIYQATIGRDVASVSQARIILASRANALLCRLVDQRAHGAVALRGHMPCQCLLQAMRRVPAACTGIVEICRQCRAVNRVCAAIDDHAGPLARGEPAQIGQPTLSQQLAVLRNTGLVKTRKDAKLVFYRIDQAKLENVVRASGKLVGQSVPLTDRPRQAAPGVANFAKLG